VRYAAQSTEAMYAAGRARGEGQEGKGSKRGARREGLEGKGKKGSREGTLNEKGVYKYVQSDVLAC